jgi:hypothetical protein
VLVVSKELMQPSKIVIVDLRPDPKMMRSAHEKKVEQKFLKRQRTKKNPKLEFGLLHHKVIFNALHDGILGLQQMCLLFGEPDPRKKHLI